MGRTGLPPPAETLRMAPHADGDADMDNGAFDRKDHRAIGNQPEDRRRTAFDDHGRYLPFECHS